LKCSSSCYGEFTVELYLRSEVYFFKFVKYYMLLIDSNICQF